MKVLVLVLGVVAHSRRSCATCIRGTREETHAKESRYRVKQENPPTPQHVPFGQKFIPIKALFFFSLTVLKRTPILCQACPGSEQQHHFVSSGLDQLDGPRVGNAARWLAVYLHDLISNL